MKKGIFLGFLFLMLFFYTAKFTPNKKQANCLVPQKFNKEQWLTNQATRYCMLDDIIASKILLNKSKKEVKTMLGEPFMEGVYYNGESMSYRTAEKANQYLTWYLFIELEKDTVVHLQTSAD